MDNKYELRGITWDHVRGYGPLEASVKPFEEQTGIRIKWERRSLKNFGDASLDGLAREYDLIILDHPHMGVAASLQCLTPFDEISNQKTLHDLQINGIGPSYESYRYNGRQWALPIDAACQVASYRKDLLNYPLPENWPGVLALAQHLKSQNQYIGMALCPTDCLCSFLTLCAQTGDSPSENKRFLVSKDTGCYVLNMLRKLYAACHPESLSWNPISLYNRMTAENDVVYCPLAFGYINYSQPGYSRYQLQFTAIPGRVGALLGGAGIAVSKYCRNIPSAAQYAAWVCSEPIQSQLYLQSGGQPAHKKTWQNKEADELAGHFFSNTLSTMEKSYVRPQTYRWPVFQERLGEIIHQYLQHHMTTDETWKRISECYRHIMKLTFNF